MKASMVPFDAASKHSNGLHDLAPREDLDPEAPAARLLDDLRQLLGGGLHVEPARPRRRHAPLDFRLGDDVRRVDDRGGRGGSQRPTGLDEEPAPVRHDMPLLIPARTADRRSRRPDPRDPATTETS